jgi:mono/diheme cytochrome c family protein
VKGGDKRRGKTGERVTGAGGERAKAMSKINTTTMIAVLGLAALAVAGGCRGDRSESRPRQFIPDMDDSPKFKPQTKTPFFADGRAMRQPVAGTVAFGMLADVGAVQSGAESLKALPSRDRFLREDDAYFRGQGPDGKWLATVPARVTIDRAALERGQERFNVYCSSCHGYDGLGKGTVGTQWSYGLPNFMDTKYIDPKVDAERATDGFIFHTIRNGVAGTGGELKMPAYGDKLPPEDAWKIVAYIRALQAAQRGTPADLPEVERQRLEQARPGEVQRRKQNAGAAAPAGGGK